MKRLKKYSITLKWKVRGTTTDIHAYSKKEALQIIHEEWKDADTAEIIIEFVKYLKEGE